MASISTFRNIEEIEDDVLEYIIDNLHSIEGINKWLKDYLDIDLRQDTHRWNNIVEIFERRNIAGIITPLHFLYFVNDHRHRPVHHHLHRH